MSRICIALLKRKGVVLYIPFLRGGGGGVGGPTPNRLVYKISYKKLIIKLLVISKATAGEKHPQSGSQGACGPKNDPEATPEYKKMEKNSEKTAFWRFWPCWAK